MCVCFCVCWYLVRRQVGGVFMCEFSAFPVCHTIIWICLGVCVCKCVLVWVRLSHIKASCHRLPNVIQAPVCWHPPIHFHSAPCPMTKSVESMIYLFSFLINSLHLHALLLFFFYFCDFPFLVFSPIPMERQRNVFMLKNGCKMNAFCAKCGRLFFPSITLSKGYVMQLKNLETFHWGT